MPENLSLRRQARSNSQYAVPPPDYKAGGDSKREELCQQDPQTFTTTATGASSSSGRLEAVKDPLHAGEVKVNPQTNTWGERNIRSFDDPAKRFQPQNREEQEFYTMLLHSIFANLGNNPADLRDLFFDIAPWSRLLAGFIFGYRQANTDGETHINKFDNLAKKFAPRSEDKHNFSIRY